MDNFGRERRRRRRTRLFNPNGLFEDSMYDPGLDEDDGMDIEIIGNSSSQSSSDDSEPEEYSPAHSDEEELNRGPEEEPVSLDSAPSTSAKTSSSGNEPGPSTLDHNSSFDEGATCSICFEYYTSSGNHRLVCIACGHLFGQKCIERWIQSAGGGRRNKAGTCPQCKKPARVKDIRQIFAKTLKMVDTSDLERAKAELKTMMEEKNKLMEELAHERIKGQMELAKMKKESAGGAGTSKSGAAIFPRSLSGREGVFQIDLLFVPFMVSREKQARVFAVAPAMQHAVVSCSQPHSLFEKFGVRKIDLASGIVVCYVAIHSADIRDLKFSPLHNGQNERILSASMDKTLALTEFTTNQRILSIKVGAACWSCCFMNHNSHYVFAGTGNGKILMYDTRLPVRAGEEVTSVVSELKAFGPPILAMFWVDNVSDRAPNSRGLLVASIRECIFYEAVTDTEFKAHSLFHGSIYSLSYCAEYKMFLISTRPSQSNANISHMVCELSYQNEPAADGGEPKVKYALNLIQEFSGGKKAMNLAKNALFAYRQDQVLASVFDENAKQVSIWKAAEGVPLATWASDEEDIIQSECIQLNGKSVFLCLSKQKLNVFELKD